MAGCGLKIEHSTLILGLGKGQHFVYCLGLCFVDMNLFVDNPRPETARKKKSASPGSSTLSPSGFSASSQGLIVQWQASLYWGSVQVTENSPFS